MSSKTDEKEAKSHKDEIVCTDTCLVKIGFIYLGKNKKSQNSTFCKLIQRLF